MLLCLPHAGGGALSYAGWDRHPLGGFEPVAVCLPGREDPLRGGSRLRLGGVGVRDRRLPHAPGAHRPLAVFGHSMGALTGYELLRELARRKRPAPLLLAVSAHRAPQEMPTAAGPPRSPRELLDYVRRLDDGGTAELLDDPEWRDLVLRPLGADLRLHDTYRSSAEPRDSPAGHALRRAHGRGRPHRLRPHLRGLGCADPRGQRPKGLSGRPLLPQGAAGPAPSRSSAGTWRTR
ncbi:hypothetical protein SCALM49S_10033 [Streptomyces californicus]